jgi:hypothetical protein
MDELTVGIADATVAMAAALTPARVASGTTRMGAYVVRERVINKKKKTYNVRVVTVLYPEWRGQASGQGTTTRGSHWPS